MGSKGESVTVRFHVNGIVKVERTYSWVESWKDLTRQVAADMNNGAPALALAPVEVKVDGEVGCLCVDTGSPNGSVVIHFHEQRDYPEDCSLMDILLTPVKVKRSWAVPLAAPYQFKKETHPER